MNEKREERRNAAFRNIKRSPRTNIVASILNNFSHVCSYAYEGKIELKY